MLKTPQLYKSTKLWAALSFIGLILLIASLNGPGATLDMRPENPADYSFELVFHFVIPVGLLAIFALASKKAINDLVSRARLLDILRENWIAIFVVAFVYIGCMYWMLSMMLKGGVEAQLAEVAEGLAQTVHVSEYAKPANNRDIEQALDANVVSLTKSLYSGLVVVLLSFVVISLFTGLRKKKGLAQSELEDEVNLGDELKALAKPLGTDKQTRSVVEQIYLRLLQVVQEHSGVERAQSTTARELETRLVNLGLPIAPLQVITQGFERSQYGQTELSPAEISNLQAAISTLINAIKNNGGQLG